MKGNGAAPTWIASAYGDSCLLTEEVQLGENTYTQKKTVLTETEQAATHAAAVHLVNSIQRQHPITLDDGSFLDALESG